MKDWKTALWLTLAAVGFRILHFVFFANEFLVGGDQMQYIKLARRFASGDFSGVLDTYWTPLYPLLLGIISSFSNSLVLPSIIFAVLTGSLAVTLTYILVEQSYGRREAVIAAVIAIFYPHLISSVFDIGTENLYLLLMIGAVLVGWRGLTNNLLRDYLLVGVLLGLAYLTRPEAFGYPFFFASLVFVKNLWQKKLLTRQTLAQTGILFLGFMILAAPYLFYLRGETGKWTISGKVDNNFHAVELLEESAQEDNNSNASGLGANFQTVKSLVTNIVHNLIHIHLAIPYLLPVLLAMLVALGLFGERWNGERLWRETYLISFCLITVLCYAATVVQSRYFYILLPIFFGWLARGIVHLERWLNESLQDWLPEKRFFRHNSKSFVTVLLILIYLYVLPLNFFVRSTEKAWQVTSYEERDAGLWLKENTKPSAVILSPIHRPVFYAERQQLELKTADVAEIAATMKSNQADYILISERSLKRHPHLKGLSESLQGSPEFEVAYQNSQNPDYKMWIFKLK